MLNWNLYTLTILISSFIESEHHYPYGRGHVASGIIQLDIKIRKLVWFSIKMGLISKHYSIYTNLNIFYNIM